jgi:hypothetical protein
MRTSPLRSSKKFSSLFIALVVALAVSGPEKPPLLPSVPTLSLAVLLAPAGVGLVKAVRLLTLEVPCPPYQSREHPRHGTYLSSLGSACFASDYSGQGQSARAIHQSAGKVNSQKFAALWLAAVVGLDIMNVRRPLGRGLGQVKHGMRRGKIRNLPPTMGRLA